MSALPETPHLHHYLPRLRKYLEEGTERVYLSAESGKPGRRAVKSPGRDTALQRDPTAVAADCTGLAKMKLSTVNLTRAWRGQRPYPSKAATVFSCVLNGEPTRLQRTVPNVQSHKKPWLKSLGHKTKKHKYGSRVGWGDMAAVVHKCERMARVNRTTIHFIKLSMKKLKWLKNRLSF